MKDTKIYIFNSASRAAQYGIGTYINQLTSCLNRDHLYFEVIYLHGEGKEVSVSNEKGYRQITIPDVVYRPARESDYYYRNVAYLLEEYIPQDKNVEYIFHLNFMSNTQLVSSLRKRYKCKIIIVSHYTNWSFALFGDERKLFSILNKSSEKRTLAEKQIYKNIKTDIKMIKKCDRFICVAQHTLDTFLKISDIDKSKCLVISNALKDEYKEIKPGDKLAVKAKWNLHNETKIILFVGRLDESKGIEFLIQAFKNLLNTKPDTRLILAGDGNYNRWFKEAGRYSTKITFTGRLDRKEILELYQIADIGVMSSLHEEFGLVALEMMMHKIPTIVGNTGGLSEIIEDNITGLKVPIKTVNGKRKISPQLLSNKMELLLENESFALEIAKNGRNRFLEKYELSSFRDKLLTLYKSL